MQSKGLEVMTEISGMVRHHRPITHGNNIMIVVDRVIQLLISVCMQQGAHYPTDIKSIEILGTRIIRHQAIH
jgi:hypothetical protein